MRKLPIVSATFAPMVIAAALLAGCATPPTSAPRQLDETNAEELAATGSRDFGIKWEGRLIGASDRGVVAVTDGTTTLTNRAGERVFIVRNNKEFPPSDRAIFRGTDADLKNIGLKLLRASGAREDEVADVRVLQQYTQTAEVPPGNLPPRMTTLEKSHRALQIDRRIAGVDVISSRLLLNVDAEGRVAFMELAWPNISPEVLERSARLRRIATDRYTAPRMEGAEIESVQAVILHTPAVGFYNDATAAIRVIYRPTSPQIGQKAVRFVDERGQDVPLPRAIDPPREEALKRSEARK